MGEIHDGYLRVIVYFFYLRFSHEREPRMGEIHDGYLRVIVYFFYPRFSANLSKVVACFTFKL